MPERQNLDNGVRVAAIEILDDLFFIERGYLNGNHFVYRSDAPILIDTGYVSDFPETERVISGLGVNLSHVSLIVNTHTHCDHIGGNRIIQERSGCGIALHKIGKHFIDTRDDWSTWWRYYDQEADFFTCTQSLHDGDTVDIGPHQFDVIHTPGHASDGIVLYHRRNKILISSDTLWENGSAVMTLRIEGSAALFQMLKSFEKIESLEVEAVYPGHGRPFGDMGNALAKQKDKMQQYLMDRGLVGGDLIKKIMVYTLLMKGQIREDRFFESLMETHWYPETVKLYFNGGYEAKYQEVMQSLLDRGTVQRKDGFYHTTVKP